MLQRPTQLGYVLLLIGLSFVIGYAVALLRGRPVVRKLLAKVDYHLDPEGSIYAQTLKHMSPSGTVLIELKDGRRIWGCPRGGPQTKEDDVEEIYIVFPEAEDEAGEWQAAGAGLIVPLSEVSYVALSEEPTGAIKD